MAQFFLVGGRVVKAFDYKTKVSQRCGFDSWSDRPHVGKGVFFAVGPYWLSRGQYNVSEWHAVLIWMLFVSELAL